MHYTPNWQEWWVGWYVSLLLGCIHESHKIQARKLLANEMPLFIFAVLWTPSNFDGGEEGQEQFRM